MYKTKREWLVKLLCALKRRAYCRVHVLGKYDAFLFTRSVTT